MPRRPFPVFVLSVGLAVTGDGQFAACGRANQIFIYHVPTGQIVARMTDPKPNLGCRPNLPFAALRCTWGPAPPAGTCSAPKSDHDRQRTFPNDA